MWWDGWPAHPAVWRTWEIEVAEISMKHTYSTRNETKS